jgi:hypothetical protein
MQAAHRVATVQSSATTITNVATYNYCTTSLYYTLLFEGESWSWHVLLSRLNSDSYHGDALQYTKQLLFISLPLMSNYCIRRECENIFCGYLYDYDLALVILKGISSFKFPERFLEISCRDLTSSLSTFFSI